MVQPLFKAFLVVSDRDTLHLMVGMDSLMMDTDSLTVDMDSLMVDTDSLIVVTDSLMVDMDSHMVDTDSLMVDTINPPDMDLQTTILSLNMTKAKTMKKPTLTHLINLIRSRIQLTNMILT